MVSREGEVVPLATNVTVAKDARANDWLTRAEQQMHQTLASQLEQATQSLAALGGGGGMDNAAYFDWLEPLPTQIATLSTLVGWSNEVEAGLKAGIEALKSGALKQTETVLRLLSERVLTDLKPDQRKKCEQLITVVVHKRDVTRQLIEHAVSNLEDFRWLYYMRFYYSPSEPELMHRLNIKMASASFFYGFEYWCGGALGANAADRPLLLNFDTSVADAHGWQSIRPCWHGQDRICQSTWCRAWPIRACLQL